MFISNFSSTSTTPFGASCCTASANVIFNGNKKLPATATIAPIIVLNI